MLLLDTSVLIEFEGELADQRVGPVRRYLGRAKSSPLACTTVTIGELAAGDDDENAVRFLVRNLRKLGLSETVAFRAGALERQLSARGQRLGENDNWIAATALSYSATLVYCDGDFERVPGLKRHFIDLTG
jgi:predicted nucleic acid-binding protein